ncbi:hypothetical protein CCUS01_08215 [Colletotrichum cuscutae]|uniref:Uncharacterized protein n=1 Tax=Colletotrichum cuscutae TaxID=1209917 RepID=A0AAI9USB3_9PEZI|nr:hypothetical protein CCUS01_08215 [Colletotrichum cuscutae]
MMTYSLLHSDYPTIVRYISGAFNMLEPSMEPKPKSDVFARAEAPVATAKGTTAATTGSLGWNDGRPFDSDRFSAETYTASKRVRGRAQLIFWVERMRGYDQGAVL